MSQLFTVGRVETDLVLKWSERSKRHYVYFTVAERLGYGASTRHQYIQVWAWGSDAERIVKMKVGKHTRVWVTGTVELCDFVRGGGAKDKGLKLYLTNWGFVSDAMPQSIEPAPTPMPKGAAAKAGAPPQTASIQVIRGDKDILPE